MSACDEGEPCRWATVEVWLHTPEVAAGDVPTVTTNRQVCLRCGTSRLVRSEDGRTIALGPGS